MALVNFLRFSKTMGAIITDEEFWTPRFRKRLHIDNLHSLLDEETSSAWNMEIAYGGVGYPSVHQEVVTGVRKILQDIHCGKSERPAPERVRDIARITFDVMQEAIRRRIDQKLLFKFGFTSDDLNRGYREIDGKKIQIKNKEIKKEAQNIATGKDRDTYLKPAMDAKAAIFGYDPQSGLTGYYLDSQEGILAYNYEGFEAMGSGKYASGMVFGKLFGARTLAMRQEGFSPAEGIFELVSSALSAQYHFKEVGGTLHFVLLSADRETHGLRYREIFDEPARLTAEIVKAVHFNEIDRAAAFQLIERLVVQGEEWQGIERDLFSSVRNRTRFLLLMRNYKMEEVDRDLLPGLAT